MVELANTIWADGPSGNPSEPQKSQIRTWGTWLEGLRFGSSLLYSFSATTADADPGAGVFRFNNADAALATAAYIDNVDAGGTSAGAILDTWDDSTNAVKGTITLRGIDDPSVLHVYNVTGSVVDGTGYRKLTLVHVGGTGTFVAAAQYLLNFARSGDVGGVASVAGLTGVISASDLQAAVTPGFTSGTIVPAKIGFFKDDTPTTQIHRLRDRVFFGDAVKYTGNRLGSNGYGGDWLSENGASYFIKNSQVAILGDETQTNRYGLLAAVRGGGIGIVGVVLNENAAAGRAGYFEGFHKGTAFATSGIEIQMGNYTATDTIPNAYTMSGARALYLAPEGGVGYTVGDADTPITPAGLPSAAAIDIGGGSLGTAAQRWRVGLVFRNGSLYRATGGTSGNATAISLAQNHGIQWEASSTIKGAQIRSDVTAVASQDVALIFQNTQVVIGGTGERTIALFKDDVAGSGAVNWLQFTNSRTLIPNSIRSKGSDTDAALDVSTLGIGVIRFQSHDGSGEHMRISPASAAVNFTAVTGGAAGINPRIAAAGAGTDLSQIVRGKGTGGVRLENASATALFETTSTGIGFFATTPVAAKTGWGVPTGTFTRTTYVTSTVTLPQLAEHVAALVQDLHQTAGYGLLRT